MKHILALAALALISACGGLPAGQADGGVTSAETEQLNEAAAILDSQSAAPLPDSNATQPASTAP